MRSAKRGWRASRGAAALVAQALKRALEHRMGVLAAHHRLRVGHQLVGRSTFSTQPLDRTVGEVHPAPADTASRRPALQQRRAGEGRAGPARRRGPIAARARSTPAAVGASRGSTVTSERVPGVGGIRGPAGRVRPPTRTIRPEVAPRRWSARDTSRFGSRAETYNSNSRGRDPRERQDQALPFRYLATILVGQERLGRGALGVTPPCWLTRRSARLEARAPADRLGSVTCTRSGGAVRRVNPGAIEARDAARVEPGCVDRPRPPPATPHLLARRGVYAGSSSSGPLPTGARRS